MRYLKPITLDEINQAQRILSLAAIEGQQRLMVTGDAAGARKVIELSLSVNQLCTELFALETGIDLTLGESEPDDE